MKPACKFAPCGADLVDMGGGEHWAQFSWTNAPLPAYTVITLVVLWQAFPFVAVSVLAGLKTIPAELHEAARVDGAGPWRVIDAPLAEAAMHRVNLAPGPDGSGGHNQFDN